jgi:hypothetical protein
VSVDTFVFSPYRGREMIIIENSKEPVTEHSSAGIPIMYRHHPNYLNHFWFINPILLVLPEFCCTLAGS